MYKAGILAFFVLSCTSPPSKGYTASPLPPSTEKAPTLWEVIADSLGGAWRSSRWALLLHRPTRLLLDTFLSRGIPVEIIYAPEHGLYGEKPAGAQVADTLYHGVPVVSLYGKRKAPAVEELEKVDALLIALRDVGVRHYTYLSTVSLALRAAAQAGKPVWLIDFPNPHAHYTYGPPLDSSLLSFVGMHAIPLVPGLTIGEYARLLIDEKWVPPVSLSVIRWPGWRRREPLPTLSPFFTEPPSPALQTITSIELYPILGWYEGTCCVSIGRGTPSPFEQVGIKKAKNFPRWDTVLYGYHLTPVTFRPQGEREDYAGWRIERRYSGPVQPDSLFRLGFWLLRTFRQAYAGEGDFYHAEFFDKLFGTPLLRWMEEKGLPIDTLYQAFTAPPEWKVLHKRYAMEHP